MGAKERGLSSRQHFAGVVVAGQSSRSRSETTTPVSDQGEPSESSGELLNRKKPTSHGYFCRSKSECDPCDDSKIPEVDGRMSGIELSSNRNARVTEWGGTPLKKAT